METSQLLIVDDDRLILHVLGTGLRSAGYRTVDADSAESAIRIAHTLPIDLAIIDVRMPGMSGLELAGYLRTNIAMPCLFLSAYSDAAIVGQAIAEGALGYLVKPIDVPNMVPSIEAALARSKELSGLRKTEAQLNAALEQRRDISIATGLLMERYALSEVQAFARLRQAARTQRRKLAELAAEHIAGRGDLRMSFEMGEENRPSPKT